MIYAVGVKLIMPFHSSHILLIKLLKYFKYPYINYKFVVDKSKLRHILYYILKLLDPAMSKSDNTKEKRLRDQGALNPHPERVTVPEFQHDTFFDPRDIVQVKYEMLRLVERDGVSKLDAAKRFGFSRPTFYQAKAAFDQLGLEGLLPQQRGPKGAHKLDVQVMAFIDKHLDENGLVPALALAELIEDEFQLHVHPRSIERALQRKKKRQQKQN